MDEPKVAPNFDEPTELTLETEEEKTKSFTSWKLELMDAIDYAATLTPTQKLVARRLLQHANKIDRKIYPSQGRIAALLNLSIDTIKRAIKELSDKNWLEIKRPNYQKSNHYEFTDKHISASFESKESRLEYFNEEQELRQKKRAEIRNAKLSEGANTPCQDSKDDMDATSRGSRDATSRGSNYAPLTPLGNNLKGTPEVSKGIEQGNLSSDTREASTKKEITNE